MSSRLWVVGFVFLASAVLAATGSAQSLQDRKMWQNDDQTLAEEVAYTNQLCHSNIQASVDWRSFSSQELIAGAQPLESCDAVLGAIESLCTDQMGQEAVREHVTHVVCVKGAPRDVDLKQGTLFFRVDGALSDNFQFVREYLVGKVTGEESDD